MTRELRTTVAKNSAYLSFSGLASAFFMYLFVVTAARRLGVDHFGAFNFTLTLVITVRTLFDIGLGNYAQREIARDRGGAGRLIWNILGIKAVLTVLFAVTVAAFVQLSLHDQLVRQSIYWALLMEGAQSFANFTRSVFRAYQRMAYEALIWTAEGLLTFGGGLALFAVTRSVSATFVFLAAVALLKMAVSIGAMDFLVRLPWAWRWDWTACRKIALESLPFGILIALAMMYIRMDTVILGTLRGEGDVGIYSAAYKIYEAFGIIVDAFFGVLFPLLSAFFLTDLARTRQIASTALRYNLLYAVPVAVTVAWFAEPILRLVFGSQYLAAAPILQILVITIVFRSMLSTHMAIFFAAKQETIVLWAYAGVTLFNIAINLLMIPRWGATGAACAALITEILLLSASIIIARAKGLALHWLRPLPLMALLAAALAGVYALARPWGLWGGLAAGVVCYVIFVAGFRLVDFRELKTMAFKPAVS